MNHFLFKKSSLYVLFCFFCFIFVLIFYDTYRAVHYDANFFVGEAPKTAATVHTERAILLQYDKFMEEIKFLHKRDTMQPANLDQRHKLRWLYKSVEAEAYRFIAEKISVRAMLYAKDVHYALVVLTAFIFILLTVEHVRGMLDFSVLVSLAFVLYTYTALTMTSHRMYDQHSLIEMAVHAAGLYFAVKKRIIPFLIVLFVAVANRETGSALGVVYAAINWRERLFWLPVVLGPIMLAAINVDLLLLPDFYNPNNFVTTKTNLTYITLLTLPQAPFTLIAFTAIKMFTFFAPVFFLFSRAKKSELGRRLLLVVAIFCVILMFGTVLGHLQPYAMLVPAMCTLWARAYPAAGDPKWRTPA